MPEAPPHETIPPDAQTRRARFPRGLTQPADGFRFAADTLLLAAFAAQTLGGRKPLTGLDIGTGCGAASFGLLLLRPDLDLHLTGIDASPELLACAQDNARGLGLDRRFAALDADAAVYAAPACDFALLNAPFRTPGTGRACPNHGRERARFEGPGGFALFAGCAARNLRTRGRLFLVHLSERLPALFAALVGQGLAPKRLLPVQGRGGQSPRLVLIAAVRGGGPGLNLLPPLTLYDDRGGLTPEAERFCPPLAVNPRRTKNPGPAPLANVRQQG